MKTGFLSVETHAEHRGLVRVSLCDAHPVVATAPNASRRVRYVARFNDSDAGWMHAHEILKRRLVDLDARLYRASPARAIAAIESLGLSHQRVYLDPELGDRTSTEIAALTELFRRRRHRKEKIFQIAGYLALALLLFNLLTSLAR